MNQALETSADQVGFWRTSRVAGPGQIKSIKWNWVGRRSLAQSVAAVMACRCGDRSLRVDPIGLDVVKNENVDKTCLPPLLSLRWEPNYYREQTRRTRRATRTDSVRFSLSISWSRAMAAASSSLAHACVEVRIWRS